MKSHEVHPDQVSYSTAVGLFEVCDRVDVAKDFLAEMMDLPQAPSDAVAIWLGARLNIHDESVMQRLRKAVLDEERHFEATPHRVAQVVWSLGMLGSDDSCLVSKLASIASDNLSIRV
eukprot:TRINITY_DN105958_c0_g1_i1.p1 TRINITY_DN105958_c0_g1~~TRINITY_DN105958_c0_g1_i1.p1  ORF type:complete len:118 (+),score=14.49 TRINITY_DN105958_c0_g1_i1:124-477(+)